MTGNGGVAEDELCWAEESRWDEWAQDGVT